VSGPSLQLPCSWDKDTCQATMGDCHLSTFWEHTLDMKDLIIGLAGVCWIMAEGIGRTWAE
jgi:hypothetical protein